MPFTHKHSGMVDHPHDTVAEARECTTDFEATKAEALAEIAAEQAVERFFEEGPHGGYYAGSVEEARDRWLDSLVGR
jgi:hypothetical protein